MSTENQPVKEFFLKPKTNPVYTGFTGDLEKAVKYWNYRILVKDPTDLVTMQGLLPSEFGIHEVHYLNDVPLSYSVEPVKIEGLNSVEEVHLHLEFIKNALEKEPLWFGSLQPYKPN